MHEHIQAHYTFSNSDDVLNEWLNELWSRAAGNKCVGQKLLAF